MTYTRRIGALSALAFTLVLAACSTPEDLTAPPLEPQFGTTNDDKSVDVVVGPGGSIYGLYNYAVPAGCNDDYCYERTDAAKLTRYNATGGIVWQRDALYESCEYNYCNFYKTEAAFVDANNYSYVLVSRYDDGTDGSGPLIHYRLERFAPLGEPVAGSDLGYFGAYPGELSYKAAMDASGNIYTVFQNRTTTQYGAGTYVSKYTRNMELVWQRGSSSSQPYGTPTGITVSSSGDVYVVGTKGFSRFSSAGTLLWNKTGTFEQVAVSGSNIYTRYRKDVRKWDNTGRQLWLRAQSGLNTLVLQDIDGDGSGNLYLSGKYDAGGGNMNAMVRKLSASGSVLWTKTYGTSRYDDALGVATATGSEIYTVGETQGSLAHPSYGGPQNRDGYLRKQNSTGSLVWTR